MDTTQQYGQGAVDGTKQVAGQASKYASDSADKAGQSAKQFGQQAAEQVKDTAQQSVEHASATANQAGRYTRCTLSTKLAPYKN